MKYIFEDIIETKEIHTIIEAHADNSEDKKYLVTIIKDIVHHKIVDLILDELDEEKKLVFLENIDNENKHRDLLNVLSEWIVDFENKIKNKVKESEQEIIAIIENQ